MERLRFRIISLHRSNVYIALEDHRASPAISSGSPMITDQREQSDPVCLKIRSPGLMLNQSAKPSKKHFTANPRNSSRSQYSAQET